MSSRYRLIFGASPVLALIAACGSSSPSGSTGAFVNGSCTLSESYQLPSGESSVYRFCIEYQNLSAQQIQQLQQTCTSDVADSGIALTATFSRTACSRQGVVAGCRIEIAGVTETEWYYAGETATLTAEDLQLSCQQGGSTPLSASGAPVRITDAGTD